MLEVFYLMIMLWMIFAYLAACDEIETLKRVAPDKLALFQNRPWLYIAVSFTLGPIIYAVAFCKVLHR